MAEVLEPAIDLEPWHVDDFVPIVKTFLYLSDVSEECGPLRIMPASHRPTENQDRVSYAICRGGTGATYYDQPTCRRFDREGKRVLGKAGTVIIWDVRGTHAGSLCRPGHQRVAMVTGFRPFVMTRLGPWNLPDPERAPLPAELPDYQMGLQ